ncbi:hypothetical protein TorRG33x02_079350 [Trema orientale]|uniref:Uncharacterized protein n=1 Tax=Trema orientale TaxID=63057 RepID=A0A2P5FF14_TREOI|nr:hypothetical protein TorRG33x02_079350 [Trema orientale]
MVSLGMRIPVVFITSRVFFSSSGTNSSILSLRFPLSFALMYLSMRLRTPSHNLQKDGNLQRSSSNCRNTFDMSFIARTSEPSMFRYSFGDLPNAISNKSSSTVKITPSKHSNHRVFGISIPSTPAKDLCSTKIAWFLTSSLWSKQSFLNPCTNLSHISPMS